MNIKKRLKVFIYQMNIMESNFYKCIHVTNNYLEKDGAISTDKLILILNSYPNLNYKWLLFGEGNMLESNDLNKHIVSCDDANCLKNYAIKLQKEKINRLENIDVNEDSYSNSYN